MKPHLVLRVARPTNDLASVIRFYRDGLGLQELFRFDGHDGFDGVILGQPGDAYHFEFTHAHGHDAGRAPTADNLVVLYMPDRDAWETAVRRMKDHGYAPVVSFNPYWDRQGVTFEDCDGYRVVLQNADWRTVVQKT
ncbi:VOC family protein [Mesorhizobium shangrilense]|uniref:VOC family protein n=1 Tax=Mesorhizobium shangrilense TaxID=460060 RepID=A0ABV2D8B9_9HYPH